MLYLNAPNVSNAAYASLHLLKGMELPYDGEHIHYHQTSLPRHYKSDKGNVSAIDNVLIEIPFSGNRWLTLDGRHNSIIATIAEICWIMSGSNNIEEWLNFYLKRAPMFSDDGKTWRAGYARIFQNGQIDTVLYRLNKSHNTRQAVFSIYNPTLDTNEGLYKSTGSYDTKDFPCNNMMYFTHNKEGLNLHVTARGLDWAWGIWSINYEEFTFLQEFIASILGLKVGNYTVYVNNLHLYEDVEVVNKQIENILSNKYYPNFDKYQSTLDTGLISDQRGINELFGLIIDFVNRVYCLENKNEYYHILHRYGIHEDSELEDWIKLLIAHRLKKLGFNQSEYKCSIKNTALIEAVKHDHFNSDLI